MVVFLISFTTKNTKKKMDDSDLRETKKKSFIYTGNGDKGTTSLQGMGAGVPKTDPVFSLLDQFELLQLAVGRVMDALRQYFQSSRKSAVVFSDNTFLNVRNPAKCRYELDPLVNDFMKVLVNCQHVLWELSGVISRSCRRRTIKEPEEEEKKKTLRYHKGSSSSNGNILSFLMNAFFFPTKSLFQYDDDDDDEDSSESDDEEQEEDDEYKQEEGASVVTKWPAAQPNSVETMETLIDIMEARLPPLRNFIRMDIMSENTMKIHEARLRAREVERAFLAFLENEDYVPLKYGRPGEPSTSTSVNLRDCTYEAYYRMYFNRLSDFFFQLARFYNLVLCSLDPPREEEEAIFVSKKGGGSFVE